jgi:hypothetical protein
VFYCKVCLVEDFFFEKQDLKQYQTLQVI